MVDVLYFAACRARTQVDREALPELAGQTVAAAKATLVVRHPALSDVIDHCRVALDHAFVDDSAVVSPSSEFALIPPVAGG